MKNETKILTCICSHAYQDEKYGLYKRVHTPMKKAEKSEHRKYRCTICERIKD